MELFTRDVAEFERELRAAAARVIGDDEALDLFKEALVGFGESMLPLDENVRRLGRVVAALGTTQSRNEAFAEIAVTLTEDLRTAAMSVMPADVRRSAYLGDAQNWNGQGTDDLLDAEVPQTPPLNAEGENDSNDEDDGQAADEEWRTVALLGTNDEISANAQWLKSNDYKGVRVVSISQYHDLGGERLCGVVVHAGWWPKIGDGLDVLKKFVRDLLLRSDVLHIRLDTSPLEASDAQVVASIMDELGPDVRARVQPGSDATLGGTDKYELDRYSGLLADAARVRVGVEGIDENDRQLLALGAALFAGRGASPVINADHELKVEPLTGGRSGSKVLRVTCVDPPMVFVAKVDDLDKLRDEHARTVGATPPDDPIDMKVYALDGKGVMIQRLARDLDHPLERAPSLKERLEQFASLETGNAGVTAAEVDDLMQSIDRLVERVKGSTTLPLTGPSMLWVGWTLML
jgi:hypothetical protein